MWATYKGHKDTVNLLLDHNADVNAHGNYHISSLIWAVGRGYVEIARLLIQRGAKVTLLNKRFKFYNLRSVFKFGNLKILMFSSSFHCWYQCWFTHSTSLAQTIETISGC